MLYVFVYSCTNGSRCCAKCSGLYQNFGNRRGPATIWNPALPADPNGSMEKRPDAALIGGEGSQKGEAGVEFKIFAESDGYMMINVSYDHAHNTGGPVKLAFHINHPAKPN